MKNGVLSCSEMNVMDNLGWKMELWGKRMIILYYCAFCVYTITVMGESNMAID